MKTFRVVVAAMLLAGWIQTAGGTEQAPAAPPAPTAKRSAVEPLTVPQSTSTAGQFNALIIFLADQLERNMDRSTEDASYIVTSFSRLDKLNDTSSFGRLLAENLIHELQVRNWQVYDVRLTKDIVMTESGEFILSRDIKKIRDSYKVTGVVTGTYAVNGGSVIVNARAIDLESGTVISSGQIHVPVNRFTENLLYAPEQRAMIRIIGEK